MVGLSSSLKGSPGYANQRSLKGNKNWSHLPHLHISFQRWAQERFHMTLGGFLDKIHSLPDGGGCSLYREKLGGRIDLFKQYETKRQAFYKPSEWNPSGVAEKQTEDKDEDWRILQRVQDLCERKSAAVFQLAAIGPRHQL
jgi:hypothetical protein